MTYDESFDFPKLVESCWGLCHAVIARAIELTDNGFRPAQPYAEIVQDIARVLRSWLKPSIDDVVSDADQMVTMLAQAFLDYIYRRYDDGKDIISIYEYLIDSEYETFSECLRADVGYAMVRLNEGLVGLEEFLRRMDNDNG